MEMKAESWNNNSNICLCVENTSFQLYKFVVNFFLFFFFKLKLDMSLGLYYY